MSQAILKCLLVDLHFFGHVREQMKARCKLAAEDERVTAITRDGDGGASGGGDGGGGGGGCEC